MDPFIPSAYGSTMYFTLSGFVLWTGFIRHFLEPFFPDVCEIFGKYLLKNAFWLFDPKKYDAENWLWFWDKHF